MDNMLNTSMNVSYYHALILSGILLHLEYSMRLCTWYIKVKNKICKSVLIKLRRRPGRSNTILCTYVTYLHIILARNQSAAVGTLTPTNTPANQRFVARAGSYRPSNQSERRISFWPGAITPGRHRTPRHTGCFFLEYGQCAHQRNREKFPISM